MLANFLDYLWKKADKNNIKHMNYCRKAHGYLSTSVKKAGLPQFVASNSSLPDKYPETSEVWGSMLRSDEFTHHEGEEKKNVSAEEDLLVQNRIVDLNNCNKITKYNKIINYN